MLHIPFHLAAAVGVYELLGRLGDDGVAVVVKPVDEWTARRIFLILDHRRVMESAKQRPAALKFREKALVVDVEAKRLGGRIKKFGPSISSANLFARFVIVAFCHY